MPTIARPRPAAAQPSRDHRSEFQHPTPDGFIGDVEPPLGEEFLDVPIAQREAQVEPDRVLDNYRRKAVAAVGDFSHRASVPSASLPDYPVKLTKPSTAPSRPRVRNTRMPLGWTAMPPPSARHSVLRSIRSTVRPSRWSARPSVGPAIPPPKSGP